MPLPKRLGSDMRRFWDALFIVCVVTSLILAAVAIDGNLTDPTVCWTSC